MCTIMELEKMMEKFIIKFKLKLLSMFVKFQDTIALKNIKNMWYDPAKYYEHICIN